ncbi:polygalacturonase inhibitor 2-like [Silene latifolia]|uniref:polygalacturonase inhibitor 2-like n=1 Tax=Silene latifolia TaxID=37657 RepID=UPI003D76E7E1
MSPSKLNSFPLLFFLLLSQAIDFSHSQSTPDLCHPHDKRVLLRIKTELGHPSSFGSWDPNTDCCFWLNIQCNDQGHVTSLSITEANDIHGPIPPFLDRLPSLTGLYISNVPNLYGPIPSYLSKLTNLISLVISGTKVTGPIPSFLGQFTNLAQLELSSNKLSGPVPYFLGQLKRLTYLDLSSNGLTGVLPPTLAQLANLALLRLDSNKLFGSIPKYLARLHNLNSIYFDSNSLSGSIPTSLGQMPNLTSLSLSNNNLYGPIPHTLGRTNLFTLNLAHNKLSGDASFLFDKANTARIDIRVDYNLLKFDFSNVDLGRNLAGFNISHNMIYGSLPKRLGQVHVDSIDVSFNQLCGPIPNGRRFKRVDPTIFSHNKFLCGGPLQACK